MISFAPSCIVALLLLLAYPRPAQTLGSYFDSKCASCHYDDAVTCNGCHHHGARDLRAVPDKDSYAPGEPVRLTLLGGRKYGWVRASLTDGAHTEVARRTGPTFAGNDGGPWTELPLALEGRAPGTAGDHTWSAFYYGNENGWGHSEVSVDATIHVATTAPVVVRATPSESPLFFPPQGGEGALEIGLSNTTHGVFELDAWIDVVLPGGTEIGPVYGPLPLRLPGSWEGARSLTLDLPADAPSGVYSLEVLVGDYSTQELIDADSFAFVKRP